MKSFELIPYLFLSLPLLVGCSSSSRKATYPKELDYSEHYIESRVESSYGVTFVADGDTLHGILDTGADRTIVAGKQYQDRTDLLPKIHLRNAHDSIMHWHALELQDFIWEDVHFQGLRVAVDDGGNLAGGISPIIGLDVLRGSILQFDHEDNKIKLSRNKEKLKGRGVAIPCHFNDKDNIFIPLTLPNGERIECLLDTGFSGELQINSDSCDVSTFVQDPLHWKGRRGKTETFGLCDVSLAGKVYPESCINLSTRGMHLLGVDFLRRFKSVTIDYIERKLYFEFPEEYQAIPVMNFKKDTIQVVPLEYLASILQDYNSYGFDVERRNRVHTITRIEAELEAKNVSLGDTLVGVNNKLFYRKYLKDFMGRHQVDLCLEQREQDIELNYALVQTNEATFYLLKNGKPRILHRKRREYLKPVPDFGYSYAPVEGKRAGISLCIYPNNVTRKLSMHIPWAPLMGGRIIELNGIDDKGNTVPISNRAQKATRYQSDNQR